jgi:hypothetical protein
VTLIIIRYCQALVKSIETLLYQRFSASNISIILYIVIGVLWWEKVEWLQEPRLQGKGTRQGGVRATTKQPNKRSRHINEGL